jgi:hypothetical protein
MTLEALSNFNANFNSAAIGKDTINTASPKNPVDPAVRAGSLEGKHIALKQNYRADISGTGSIRVQLEHRGLGYHRGWTPAQGDYGKNPGTYYYTATYKQDGLIRLADTTGIKNDAFEVSDSRPNNGGHAFLDVKINSEGREFKIVEVAGRILETGDRNEARRNRVSSDAKIIITDEHIGKVVVLTGVNARMTLQKDGNDAVRLYVGSERLATAFDKALRDAR